MTAPVPESQDTPTCRDCGAPWVPVRYRLCLCGCPASSHGPDTAQCRTCEECWGYTPRGEG